MTDDRHDDLERILQDPAAEDADVARFLEVARQRLSDAPDEITRARHLTAIHAAGRRTAGTGLGWWARARAVLGLTGAKVALAGAVAVAGVGGAGATGSLPDPVQERTADVAEVFGLDFPRPDTDGTDQPGVDDDAPGPEGPSTEPPPEASTPPELPAEADPGADDRRRDEEAEDADERPDSDDVRRDDEAGELSEDADEQDGRETSEEAQDLGDDGPEQAPDGAADAPGTREDVADGREEAPGEGAGDYDDGGQAAEEEPDPGPEDGEDVTDGDTTDEEATAAEGGSTSEDPAGIAADYRPVDTSDRTRH